MVVTVLESREIENGTRRAHVEWPAPGSVPASPELKHHGTVTDLLAAQMDDKQSARDGKGKAAKAAAVSAALAQGKAEAALAAASTSSPSASASSPPAVTQLSAPVESPFKAARQRSSVAAGVVKERDDLRWAKDKFNAWSMKHAPFLPVGYVRGRTTPGPVPGAEFVRELPADAGIDGLKLFVVLSPSIVDPSLEDEATEREALLAVLNRKSWGSQIAHDDDLVCWPRLCVKLDDAAARDELYRLFTYYRLQVVILPGCTAASPKGAVFEHLESMAYLALTSFCQRIVNASDAHVKAGINLARLVDLPNTLAGLECPPADFGRIANMMEAVVAALKQATTDEVGFRILCEEAQLLWLKVSYVKELAAREGPCPRRQEAVAEKCVVGRPAVGCNMYVLSHGWDSQYHISPSGKKLRLLVEVLERLGAKDDDVVFMDYTGLPQWLPADGMPET